MFALNNCPAAVTRRIPQIDPAVAPRLEGFERDAPFRLEKIAGELFEVLT